MPTLKEEILLLLEEGAYFLLNPYIYLRHTSQYSPESIYTTVSRLEKKGLIRKFKREGKKQLKLTNLGKAVLEKHRADARSPQLRWDSRWRLVIFDIPEEIAPLRKYLRVYLRGMGFGKVQRSIWISPYDHRKKIRQFLKKLKLSDFVYQLLVDNFEGLSENLMVASFWDLPSLQNRYSGLYRDWSKRLAGFKKSTAEISDFDQNVFQAYVRHLTWDYQAILADDPLLPRRLLPDDWSGTSARRFVRRWQKKALDV